MSRRSRVASGPIRILFVHHRSELGGAPTSLSYLISNLGPGYEPHVFCPRGPAAALFQSTGARVHIGPVATFTHIWASVYRGRRWLLFARELLRLPGHVISFRRVLRGNRFDVVHLNDSPMIVAAWLTHRAAVPIVWHLRSSLPNDGDDLRSRFIRRAVSRFATRSIAITQDIAEVFDVEAAVIANSVDLDRFHPPDTAETVVDVERKLPTVTYVGFIYPSKGFREFIDAAAELRRRGVVARYLVVGGAVRSSAYFHTFAGRLLQLLDLTRDYEAEARERVRSRGLDDIVQFVPFTHETAHVYQASDIVVAPSRGPELGRPVIEAAASGVPVIATGSRTGGDVIKPGDTGIIVGDTSVASLVGAIEQLLADPERRRAIGVAARAHAERMFDPERNAERVRTIYRTVAPPRTLRTRILYVHHRPQLGGAPASLVQLIRHLDPTYEPHVFCPPGAAADIFASAGAVVHPGKVAIFAHAWDNPYRGLRWLALALEARSLWAHIRQLRRMIERYGFPVVHLNDAPLLPAAWVAHRHRAKVVWHLRSALAGEGRDRRSRFITALMNRWGDAAIAIDNDVAARFKLELPLTIVPNSVDVPPPLDAFASKVALGLPTDRVVVGYAGFVRRQKGWPELIEAAEILAADAVPVHFAIMGGGVRPPEYFRTLRGRLLATLRVLEDEETAIRQSVNAKGLGSSFSFLPFAVDTVAVYSALDIVTFPNQGVGLGRPVLEAAMHGKPVVASGSREGADVLVPNETGILLHEPTPDRLADALRKLVDNPELRASMGAAAARHARHRFDAAQNARSVEEVYEYLLGAGRGLADEPPPRFAAVV